MEPPVTSTNTGTNSPFDMIPDFDMLDEILLNQEFTFPDPNPFPGIGFLDSDKPGLENQTQLIVPNTPIIPIKDRLSHALKFIKDSQEGHEYLVQIWVPTTIGDKKVLTTIGQPYQIGTTSDRLVNYRSVSQRYQFSADESSDKNFGLPGRVFVAKMPEWTPDVRLFKEFEYPRVNYAQNLEIKGTIGLPIFERGNVNCLGVIELVMTKRKINYGSEIESICSALQAVDLRSSELQTVPRLKLNSSNSYQAAVPEIQTVLNTVSHLHNLPLAQTWIPCMQQNKSGTRHSDSNYSLCISTLDSASCVLDPSVLSFHHACSEHHLFKGDGIVGQAFLTNRPVSSQDVTRFEKFEYSLAHHAKLFNLRGAVAIRLRSFYTGDVDFVLEFFLPVDCREIGEQRELLNALGFSIQQACKSLRVVSQKEMGDVSGNGDNYCVGSSSGSWVSSVIGSPIEGFSVTPGSQVDSFREFKFGEELKFEVKEESGFGGYFGESGFFSRDKTSERRHVKTEKNITLQDLRKHFAGSLKDAAKNLGVCPTTLKRICRQNGISRWPSRKIKKVGHSLKKLQTVIDSVHGGPEGSVQLSSLYENFTKSTWEKNNLTSPSNVNNNTNNNNKIQFQNSPSNSHSSSSDTQSTVTPPNNITPIKQETSEITQNKHDMLKIKAIFGEEKVIFRLQPSWGFEDLKQEILKRFGFLDPGLINLKYLDDESEWVLLTCDADLSECLDVYKLSSARTIKISVSSSSQSQPFVSSSFYHMGLS